MLPGLRLSAALALGLALSAPALGGERDTAFFSFARPGAVHDTRARYRLPFPREIPRYLSQGVGGKATHRDRANYHAFDITMPTGTPVLNARAGVVGRVVDGFTAAGPGSKPEEANAVFVVHPDGTFASYLHLSPGVKVREGQRVGRGDLLALSGNTGSPSLPHLHFSVSRMGARGPETVAIRFGGKRSPGFVPRAGSYYGQLPRSQRKLRITLDGVPAPAERVAAGRGDSLKIEVKAPAAGGRSVDVTRDPRLRYESLTPWLVHAPEAGRVVLGPTAEFDSPEMRVWTLGTLAVLLGNPGDRDFAVGKVVFEVPAPSESAGRP